jgi:hypothetical protein
VTVIAADVAPPEGAPGAGRRGAGRGGLLHYAVRRVLTGLGTMAFVLVFNFFLFRMLSLALGDWDTTLSWPFQQLLIAAARAQLQGH